MYVETRIYKRFDTDILALYDAGYAVSRMISEAVSAYANGQPCHFLLDEVVPFDVNNKNTVRLRVHFNNKDINTINMFKKIKYGYRSNFCKQVFRNAMVHQNLSCYFTDMSLLPQLEANMKTVNPMGFMGLKNCNEYRRRIQHRTILGNNISFYQPSAQPVLKDFIHPSPHSTKQTVQAVYSEPTHTVAQQLIHQQTTTQPQVQNDEPVHQNTTTKQIHKPDTLTQIQDNPPNTNDNIAIMKMFENL